ncbi:hypothetical protein DFJ74DRAFT_771419 [Hyaloraphidium curvatum]|nr:hypothetical protein DFJ74DRAFT_771419 [Hyaloraphidium curvatum]
MTVDAPPEVAAVPRPTFSSHGAPQPGDAAVVEALRTSGFLYISEVDQLFPPALLAEMFQLAEGTFAEPEAEKERCREDADRLGWGDQRRGKVDLGARKEGDGDFKALGGTKKEEIDTMFLIREQYQFSGKWDGASHDRADPRHHPAPVERGLETIRDFTDRCRVLVRDICAAIARGLGLPEDYFDAMHDDTKPSGDQFRFMIYHPVPPPHNTSSNLRLAGHHDIGTITLLFQNGVGGLEAQGPDGTWFPVPPVPGCVTVNLGTVAEVLCGHEGLKATKHRVGMNEGGKPRYSIAYFAYPVWNTPLRPVPTASAPQEEKAPKSKFFVDTIVARLYGRPAPKEEDYEAL